MITREALIATIQQANGRSTPVCGFLIDEAVLFLNAANPTDPIVEWGGGIYYDDDADAICIAIRDDIAGQQL